MSTYAIHCLCRGMRCRVRINEAIVLLLDERQEQVEQAPIDGWLWSGVNPFRVEVAAMSESESPELVVSLHKPWHGGDIDTVTELCSYRFTRDESMLVEDWSEAASWSIVARPARYSWHDALPYRDEDRAELLATLAQIRSAFERRDAALFGDLARIARDEWTDSCDRLQARIDRAMTARSLSIDPVEPRAIRVHAGAAGKLVQLHRQDGTSVLRGLVDDQPWRIDPTFSRIDSHWRVVR
jgi:hypothetical protein